MDYDEKPVDKLGVASGPYARPCLQPVARCSAHNRPATWGWREQKVRLTGYDRADIRPAGRDITPYCARGGVSRLPFTQEHRAALDTIRGWMEKAGLTVTVDAAGTMIGRCEGPPGAPVLLFGSHQDSVRNGGMFDGIMGILLPVLALGELRDMALPFSVEVLAFADEEGVRFPTALIGPRSLAGNFDPASLELRDANGISIRQAMTDFGLDPDAIPSLTDEIVRLSAMWKRILNRGQSLKLMMTIRLASLHPFAALSVTG